MATESFLSHVEHWNWYLNWLLTICSTTSNCPSLQAIWNKVFPFLDASRLFDTLQYNYESFSHFNWPHHESAWHDDIFFFWLLGFCSLLLRKISFFRIPNWKSLKVCFINLQTFFFLSFNHHWFFGYPSQVSEKTESWTRAVRIQINTNSERWKGKFFTIL